jgi:uncharacterized membrane protein YfcA
MWNFFFDRVSFPISGVETFWWLPGLVAFVISFFTSMGGLSGAFLLLPFQVSILGFSSPAVTPTNLLFNMIAIPGGVFQYMREKRMVWPLAMTTIAGTLPGLIIGAYLRIYWFSDPEKFKLFVGLVLLYVCLRLCGDISHFKKAAAKKLDGEFSVDVTQFSLSKIEYGFQGKTYRISTPMIFVLSLGVGIVGGAYGIGGGAIIAPFVVAIFHLPVHTVAGAALMGTLVTSAAGVAIYQFLMPLIFSDQIPMQPDWLLGVSFGIGGLLGIYLGARAQRFMPSRIIKIIMAVSIGVVVLRYVGGYFLRFQ